MVDFAPGKDRFSVPDGTAIIRGLGDTGVKRGYDNIYYEEEIESEERYKGGRLKGGGVGAVDQLFDNPESANPELLSEYKNFIKERGFEIPRERGGKWMGMVPIDRSESGIKEEFGLWLQHEHDTDFEEQKLTKPEKKGVRLRLGLVDKDSPVSEQAIELQRVWRDHSASVKYVYGKDQKDDLIVFASDSLREQGKKKELAMNVRDFNYALKNDNINMEINRPRSETDRHAVYGVLKNLRVGNTVFMGINFSVVKPEEPTKAERKITPVDKEGYNLVFHQPSLDRLTKGLDKDKDKAEIDKINVVKDFLGVWTHGQNQIEALGFGTDNDRTKITSVIVKLKDGDSIVVPAHIFRRVFDVWANQGNGGLGLTFVGGEGRHAFINARTPEPVLKKVVSNININGIKLNPQARVFIGPYEKQ